jgi:hypothetical protein
LYQISFRTDKLSRIINVSSPGLDTEESRFDFRQVQRVFFPIALIAPGIYAASEYRHQAKPVNSTPAYVVTYQASCNTVSCEICGFWFPVTDFMVHWRMPPPPPRVLLAYSPV